MSGDRVRLRVGGLAFEGWLSVSVTRSIEQAAGAFELGVSSRYPGADNPIQIRPSSSCEVLLGDDLVLTGYVDSVSIDYNATSHTTTVAGRSRTCDLVDSSCVHKPGRWAKSKIEAIAADLAAPYGVAVIAASPTGQPVDRHRVEPGETVYESIERLAALRGLLVTDDERGRLVLLRAGNARATTAIELGANVVEASGKVDASGVFGEYVVKGQRTGNDQDFGKIVAQIAASATDPAIKRKRVLVVHAEKHCNAAEARLRARWEAANRLGRSCEATYTLNGWRQADGKLWQPGELVEVRDPWLALAGELLIVEATYALDGQGGSTCKLTVAPAEGYRAKIIHEKTGRGASGLWKEIKGGVVVHGVGPTAKQKHAVATPSAANPGADELETDDE